MSVSASGVKQGANTTVIKGVDFFELTTDAEEIQTQSNVYNSSEDLIEYGKIDYLTLDYLAEITISIKQKQKMKNPKFGYALFKAWQNGLEVRAIHLKMTKSELQYLGEIPVELNPES